ncbi:hypothetical protein BpHYR1_006037 [Brachionus plicatilis]|uniref:Uncharacterized protein n=1 Tax=Brachionus plicatilis TaxID=10195 RepID=A0A3M7RBD7_BRAPC|nr:hypothetical protein BpHYR1_006037 [Brachionus plicatilis]
MPSKIRYFLIIELKTTIKCETRVSIAYPDQIIRTNFYARLSKDGTIFVSMGENNDKREIDALNVSPAKKNYRTIYRLLKKKLLFFLFCYLLKSKIIILRNGVTVALVGSFLFSFLSEKESYSSYQILAKLFCSKVKFLIKFQALNLAQLHF